MTKLKCSLILKRFVVNLGEVPPREAVPLQIVFLYENEIERYIFFNYTALHFVL